MKLKRRLFQKTSTFLISSIIISLSFSGCGTQTSTNDKYSTEKADKYINALNEICTEQKINGNILVAKDGEILLNKGYGKADYEKDTSFTEDTKFLIGSNTKPITAIAIMQLHEKGLLNIKDPVSKYIPDQTRGDEITIKNLLNHTSGLQRDADVNFYNHISVEELINKIKSQPLIFEPGTKHEYSNCNYTLLAYIIEKVSGETYGKYLEGNIFKPIGMKSTKAVASNKELTCMSTGYYVSSSKLNKVVSKIYNLSVFFGAGNIYSTTKDLYLLDRALYTEKLLSKETIDIMYENGYGWGSGQLNGYEFIGHNGLLDNGYTSTFLRFTDDDLVVIALMNVRNQDNMILNIAQVLSTMALGEKYILPTKKEKISLNEEALQDLVGKYELANGNVIMVKREGNCFTLEPSIHKVYFVPYTNTEFYALGSEYRTIEFTSDNNGKINGFLFRECVVELEGKKIQ